MKSNPDHDIKFKLKGVWVDILPKPFANLCIKWFKNQHLANKNIVLKGHLKRNITEKKDIFVHWLN